MFGAVPSPQNPHVPETKEEPERKPPTKREGEAKKVYEHRLRMFRELGFNELQAEVLAESKTADWHTVKHLLDIGCSRELALDISI